MFDSLFWALYGIDVLDRFKSYSIGLLWITIAATVVGTFICGLASDYKPAGTFERYWKKFLKWMLWLIIPMVLMNTVNIAIPKKETMYMMLGVKASEAIVNSDTGQRVQKLVNKKLDEYLGVVEEVKKEGEKK